MALLNLLTDFLGFWWHRSEKEWQKEENDASQVAEVAQVAETAETAHRFQLQSHRWQLPKGNDPINFIVTVY